MSHTARLICRRTMLGFLLLLLPAGANAQWPQPQPPVPPVARLVTSPNMITIHFNGLMSEAFPDTVTGQIDFEGYRVYMSYVSGSNSDLGMIEQYDLDDYIKYTWNVPFDRWEWRENPMTIEELRCAYGTGCGDISFDPLVYTPGNPLVISNPPEDSSFYFEAVFDNQPELAPPGIHKRYPDQPYPSSLDPLLAQPSELTDDGYLKYFDYEYVIAGVTADVPVWVSVTTLDIGVFQVIMPPTESSPAASVQMVSVADACCIVMRGDVNGDAADADPVDLSYLVDFLFSGGPAPLCDEEADINGDSSDADPVDLSYLVDFLFSGGPNPAVCP